ncbi:unnamed protein product [Sphagnum balticum]
MNMITIDAERDISHSDEDNLCRRMKRIRRVYRLPTNFDINTVQTGITSDGCFQLRANRIIETTRSQTGNVYPTIRRSATIAAVQE